MAYKDAFLSNNQRLIFDTGTERINLTPRVAAGGWQMASDGTPEAYDPLTRKATFRAEGLIDWQISIGGMYYGPELLDVRAVRDSKSAFCLGFQYRVNPDKSGNETSDPAYFMGGHVVTSNIPLDGSGPILQVSAVPLQQREPLTFGKNWERRVTWATGDTAMTSAQLSTNGGSIDFQDYSTLPVIMYDIEGFTKEDSNTPAINIVLNQGTGNSIQTISIALGDVRVESGADAKSTGKAGFIDLATLPFSDSSVSASSGSSASDPTAWPTVGGNTANAWNLRVSAANITDNTLVMGIGYGERQE